MEALRKYLEDINGPNYSTNDGFVNSVGKSALLLLQKAEDEYQHHKEAYAGAMVRAYEYQTQLATLQAQVKGWYEKCRGTLAWCRSGCKEEDCPDFNGCETGKLLVEMREAVKQWKR